jgi:hypothetical protein
VKATTKSLIGEIKAAGKMAKTGLPRNSFLGKPTKTMGKKKKRK